MQAEGTYVGVTFRDPNFDELLAQLYALFPAYLDAYILRKYVFKIEQVYVIPFSSCVGAKINDARYTERDDEINKGTPRRRSNARVEQKESIARPASYITCTRRMRYESLRPT